MMDVSFALMLWGMTDRRRLLARVPLLNRFSHRASFLYAFAFMLVTAFVLTILGNMLGYV